MPRRQTPEAVGPSLTLLLKQRADEADGWGLGDSREQLPGYLACRLQPIIEAGTKVDASPLRVLPPLGEGDRGYDQPEQDEQVPEAQRLAGMGSSDEEQAHYNFVIRKRGDALELRRDKIRGGTYLRRPELSS